MRLQKIILLDGRGHPKKESELIMRIKKKKKCQMKKEDKQNHRLVMTESWKITKVLK